MNKQKLFFISVIILVLITSLACSLFARSETPVVETIPVTTEAAVTLEANLETAMVQAEESGVLTITVTEAELTSLVVMKLQSQPDQVLTGLQIFLRDGQIKITGNIKQDQFQIPLEVILTLSPGADGKVDYQIVSAKIGPMPVPQGMLDIISAELEKILAEITSTSEGQLFVESISIADGVMTFQGRIQP